MLLPRNDIFQTTLKQWEIKRLLGRGSFREVRLRSHKAQLRAVKRTATSGTELSSIEYERELKPLLEFSKPKAHNPIHNRQAGLLISRSTSNRQYL